MNFLTLQQHVKRNLGNRTDVDTLIKEWINSAYLDVVTTGKFPEARRFDPLPIPQLDGTDTFYTSASDPSFTLPSDMLFIVSLRDLTNNTPIKQRGIRWLDRYRSTTEGPPERYAQYGREVYWDPVPDASYQIQRRGRKKVVGTSLINNTDTPIIGEEYHIALEEAATYRGARSLNYPEADRWLRDLKNTMAAHSEQYTEEEEDADIGFSIKM